jgi:uncharacterized protein YdhG (YjbR/CyaY superfamily)
MIRLRYNYDKLYPQLTMIYCPGAAMPSKPAQPTTIDEYIALYPPEMQRILTAMRETIRQAAPEAGEKIGYGIPTFTLHGNLVHFGAFKDHIGFFPAPSGIEQFREQLAGYKLSKGTIQFPLDQPIPYELIRRITLFRREENLRKESKGKRS